MTAANFEYIEAFYNRKRLHSTLGYKSPVHHVDHQEHETDLDGNNQKLPNTFVLARVWTIAHFSFIPIYGVDYLVSHPGAIAPRTKHQRLHTETAYSRWIKRHIFFMTSIPQGRKWGKPSSPVTLIALEKDTMYSITAMI